MKASEMTNEELANFFDELSSFNRDDDKFREAAARLRKYDGIEIRMRQVFKPQFEMRDAIIAALRAKLKVAEDALEKITTGSFSHKAGDKPIVQVIIDIARDAFFEVREEEGEVK